MFLDIKLNGDSPIYLQIKNYIKEMILKGMLQYEEKLPSTRELSTMLKVSRNTIITAYEQLQDDGYIYIVKGKGTFIKEMQVNRQEKWYVDWNKKINKYAANSEKLDIMKHELQYKKGMISFKSISPDENLFNIEDFKRAFLNRISLEGNRLLNYGYAKGYKPLIDELLVYMTNKGVNIEGKDILITNGFTEAFDLILSSLTNEGDNILTENPTHNTAIKLMKLHGLNIIGISMKSDGMDIDDLLKKIKNNNNIKLAYIIPSYHNPTGIVMPSQKRVQIYNVFKKYKIPVIEDGFNEELRYTGSHIAPMAAISDEGNGVIYAGSFSKILFPGLRIGWILSDKKLISIIESVKRSRNIHTSFLDQAVFYEYLKQGSFEKYLKKVRREYKEKYKFAVECIKKYIPYKYIYGEGGVHLFVKLRGINSREVLKRCYSRNVIFTAGDIFYVDTQGKDTFRLGIARNSKSEIEEGFKIIGDVIKSMT